MSDDKTKAATERSKKEENAALLDVQVKMLKMETRVIKRQQNIKDLEQKMDVAADELSAFQTELRDFVEQQKSSEERANKFKQGSKNLTSSGGTAAASVSTLPSQLNDPSKKCSTGASITTPEMTSSVGHTDDLSGSCTDTTKISLPEKLKVFEEFVELQSCYTDIITSMPGSYLETVQLLENYLCTQHISDVFECSSECDANQLILNCLLEKATCKSDVLDFCETLLLLKNASQLVSIIENLRKTVMQSLQNTPHIVELPTPPTEVSNDPSVGNDSIPESASTSQAILQTTGSPQKKQVMPSTLPSAGQDKDTADNNSNDQLMEQAAKVMSDTVTTDLLEMGSPIIIPFSLNAAGDFVPADTSSGQSQQAADLMQALNQMGVGWLSALSNETGNSGVNETQGNSNVTPQNTEILRQTSVMLSNLSMAIQNQITNQSASASHSVKPINLQGSYVYTKEDQVAALASFDGYHDLLVLIDPNPLEEKLVQLKFFPDGEHTLCSDQTTSSPNTVQMKELLKKVRSIIVRTGAVKFIELVEIISYKKPYDELARHMIGCYISSGAHTIPKELKNLETSLSRAELTKIMQQCQSH